MPMTELHWACISGDYQRAQHILVKCNDLAGTLKSRNPEGRQALHLACMHGHAKIVELLLRKGSNLLSLDKKKLSPIHLASRAGHADVIKVLLRNRADPNVKDKLYGENCLHKACAGGHQKVARLLLEAGVNFRGMTNSGELPHEVAKFYKHDALSEFLQAYGVVVLLGTEESRAARKLQRWVRRNGFHLAAQEEEEKGDECSENTDHVEGKVSESKAKETDEKLNVDALSTLSSEKVERETREKDCNDEKKVERIGNGDGDKLEKDNDVYLM